MSDKRNEDLKQFIIPENFMGESRLFQGQLKTRNVVEGGLISGVLAIFFWNVISVPITTKISLVIFLSAPLGLLGLFGVNGDPLSTFIKIFFSWRRKRGLMLFNNEARALKEAPITHIEKASALKRFFSFFTQSLHESLMLLDNEIPPFPSQSINYIFVFPCSENIVVDCDNFDTKAITDTICLHTFCDDSAEKTSFHMTGFRSNDVPRGTYICVCPDKFSSANPHEIIQIFHQNFADSPAKKG